jgi:hypothetical protein
MPKRSAIAIFAAVLLISPAMAQIRSAGSGTAGFGISAGVPGSSATGFTGHGMAGGPSRFPQGHASGRRAVLLPYPYFYPDSEGGYGSQEVSQPQIVVVSPAAPAPPAVPQAPRESLLIEWQGDHFVRTTMSATPAAGGQVAPDYAEKPAPPLSSAGRPMAERSQMVQAPRQMPPAVLVFHDGRKEEVSEYTIMSGTIYSRADYWTTGSWTRKILIADLDVPATLKLNQERGCKFVLPSGPDEVVIRP